MEDTEEILNDFIIEAREILDQLELNFVRLEETPEDKKLVGDIFRAIHTLKGSSGFFAFKRLEKISHAGETLLGKIRDGSLMLDTQKTTTLLDCLDVLREVIGGIEASRREPAGDDSSLIQDLLSLAYGQSIAAQTIQEAPTDSTSPAAEIAPTAPPPAAAEPGAAPQAMKIAVSNPTARKSGEVQTEATETSDEAEPMVLGRANEVAAPVKVNLELLDKLMNLVSEMVLARNRLLPFASGIDDHNLSNAVRTVDLLTQELQERMMKTRMQPISQVWSKFPRLIRDVSNKCNKTVNLVQDGADTELDRTLLDAVRDPLVHVIRNCIDHGIEEQADRMAAGKPAAGRIFLRAAHENGMVVIAIADDGAGVNYELVRRTAIERNLVSADKAAGLTDLQLIEFIFLPGFTTASVVTNLSGRGVGMDVVKTNISNIGGTVEIDSPRGKGTTIRLKIPLTLAIMPALFVRCENERYAIPQHSIIEMVLLDTGKQGAGLEDFYGVPVFRLRKKIVPLLLLNQQLDLSQHMPEKNAVVHIAILQSAGVRFGLLVDEVLNIQEVVVKPLGPVFKGIPHFAGATILGDGRVALILDIDGMANDSRLTAKIQARDLNAGFVEKQSKENLIPMLLFDLPGLKWVAIPLGVVDRLEIFPASSVQRNGRREVVRYGDGVMHLLRLNEYVDGTDSAPTPTDAPLSVIAHYVNKLPVGLVVSKVHDIIHVPEITHESNDQQRGLMGYVLMDEKVISVVDLKAVFRARSLDDNERVQHNENAHVSIIDMDVVQ